MPLGSLLRGIRNKIYANEDWGIKCFDYVINLPDLEIDFLIQIIIGSGILTSISYLVFDF
jgi:hypothetical protein